MRKLARVALSFVLAALAGVPLLAQSFQAFPQKQYWASDYGTWSIPSQTANTYTFFPISVCTVPTASQGSFFPFAINAPVYVKDSTAANSEVLTPTAVSPSASNPSSSSCGVSISTANQHYSFSLVSGTGGLQETLNQIPATVAYSVEVDLDRNWYTAAGSIPGVTPASIIFNAKGNQAAYLVDKTVVPNQNYSWNGTNFVPSASNATAPTVAAGTGAGTSPTIAIVAGSTGTSGSFTLTTGTTPTASAAIATLTWPAVASGGFSYAPTCTYFSSGTRYYAVGTSSATAGPPATATVNATSTALTASVSGYRFTYACH